MYQSTLLPDMPIDNSRRAAYGYNSKTVSVIICSPSTCTTVEIASTKDGYAVVQYYSMVEHCYKKPTLLAALRTAIALAGMNARTVLSSDGKGEVIDLSSIYKVPDCIPA